MIGICLLLKLFFGWGLWTILFEIYKNQKRKGQRKNKELNHNEEVEVRPKKEIRYGGRLYDVTDFVGKHPGGQIIEFYVNNDEDATLPIQQFHHRSSQKVAGILKCFKSRPDSTTYLGNSEERERYARMTEDFTKLYIELEKEGCFEPSLWHVGLRIGEIFAYGTLGLYLHSLGTFGYQILGACFIGLFSGRCGWFMHEGGHHSLTGNPTTDRWLQTVAMSCGAFSASWWRSQHNRHHAMPQRLKHDVDLNTTPFFAVSTKILDNPKTAENFFLRNQVYLFFPFGAVALAANWACNLCIRYVWNKGRYIEIVLVGLYIAVFYMHRSSFLCLITIMVASNMMMFNFALSHTHRPIAIEPRHWLEYSFVHTVNIEPSWWCDWWMGYLNYQIEHHLFPTMPQFRNKVASQRVRELARKYDLPYICVSYWDAVKTTFKNFKHVSEELRQMK